MPRNKLQFSSEQVGKPSKAEAATAREQDAILRKFNDGLRFWQMCERPVCRRRDRCSDDVHACTKRHWAAMPEEKKEYWRGAFNADSCPSRPPLRDDVARRNGMMAPTITR